MNTITKNQHTSTKKTIRNVTILGAGVLGSQIAYQCAFTGFNVVSYDINDEALLSARQRFDKLSTLYGEQLPNATNEWLSLTKDRLQQSANLAQAVANADLVIEAVPESLELKQTVWAEVGTNAPSHCLFTTNTSTLLPSMFSESSGDESRFLALHFANNIWRQRVVEVMGTDKTDSKAVDSTMQFAIDMGMIPVHVKKEQAGYILNSLLVPFLNAASRLYVNEVAEPTEVDKVWKLATGAPKGPFEILDLIGLRTVHAIHSAKAGKTGDEAMQKFADIVKKEFLDQGKTGLESGSGFYDYDDNGNIINEPS